MDLWAIILYSPQQAGSETKQDTRKMIPIKIISENQLLRAKAVLAETRSALNKEQSYSQDLRNDSLIAFYSNHINHLVEAIDSYYRIEGVI